MQEQVRSMLGERTDKDALIMRGLQFAQHRVAKHFDFGELQVDATIAINTTGTGNELVDSTVTFDTTLHKIHGLGIQEDSRVTPLVGINANRWEQLIGDTASYDRGRPSLFFQRYNTVVVWRPPDQAYTLRCVYDRWPTEIILNGAKDAPSTTTATSDLDHKDDLIILRATVWCYIALNNRERANFFNAIYKDELAVDAEDTRSKPTTTQATSKQTEVISDHTIPRFGV